MKMFYSIVANGNLGPEITRIPQPARIIAADGGANHCLKLGILPDVVIGDLDSVQAVALAELKSNGVKIIRHPAAKDETDLELAINFAMKEGAAKITLFGLLGGRWDMSFANILLLASSQFEDIDFHIQGEGLEIFILRNGKSITLDGQPGDPVSVLPLGESARGVTYKGLGWPLAEYTLPFGSPIGVSNHMLENHATISLDSGVLLIFHSTQIAPGEDG
jgi:thiamine pyrophosphokinase